MIIFGYITEKDGRLFCYIVIHFRECNGIGGLFYTQVYLNLSLQDALGVLSNITMKALSKDPLKTGYIHLITNKWPVYIQKFALGRETNMFY